MPNPRRERTFNALDKNMGPGSNYGNEDIPSEIILKMLGGMNGDPNAMGPRIQALAKQNNLKRIDNVDSMSGEDEVYQGDEFERMRNSLRYQGMSHDDLNASADRIQRSLVNNLPEAGRVHALEENQGPEIPEEVWSHAEDIYLDQYGEEGFGGDGSLEMIRDIALSIMGQPRRTDNVGTPEANILKTMLSGMNPKEDPRRMDIPPEDSEYSNLPRAGEEAYVTNAPYRRNGEGPPRNFDKMRQGMDNPVTSILQKLLGGR